MVVTNIPFCMKYRLRIGIHDDFSCKLFSPNKNAGEKITLSVMQLIQCEQDIGHHEVKIDDGE